MAESKISIPLTKSRVEQIFPTLSEAQMARLASHGTSRSVPAGEVLVELGGNDIPVFLVVSGELEVVRPSFTQEISIRVIGPGSSPAKSTRCPVAALSRVFVPARIPRSSKSRVRGCLQWSRRTRS